MDVALGAKAIGTDGDLGRIHGFIVNRWTQHAQGLVVHRGLMAADRLIPWELIAGADPDAESVQLNLDKDGFDRLDEYSEDAFRARARDNLAPPSVEGVAGPGAIHFQKDLIESLGVQGSMTGKPMGYPGSEQIVSDDRQPMVLRKGSEVIDEIGEKIGEVETVWADAQTGVLTRLTIARGHLFSRDVEADVTWIAEIGPDGIALNVPKSTVEHASG